MAKRTSCAGSLTSPAPPRSVGRRAHGGGVTPPPRPGPVQGGRTASGVLAVPAPGVPALSAAYCGELRMHFPTDTGVKFPGQAIKAHSCFTCRDTALLQFSAVQNCGTQERALRHCVCWKTSPTQPPTSRTRAMCWVLLPVQDQASVSPALGLPPACRWGRVRGPPRPRGSKARATGAKQGIGRKS